jgi:Flp pilus assembly pilin Flp
MKKQRSALYGKGGENMLKEIRSFWNDEAGIGVVEVILILVVLIGLVLIFREQIRSLVESIFTQIQSKTKSVY